MIKTEDIKKLSDLARINIKDSEMESLAKDMDSILGYVGQVSSVVEGKKNSIELGEVYNVFREDQDPNTSGKHSKDLLAEAPQTQGDFIKVKKIL